MCKTSKYDPYPCYFRRGLCSNRHINYLDVPFDESYYLETTYLPSQMDSLKQYYHTGSFHLYSPYLGSDLLNPSAVVCSYVPVSIF